MAAEVLLEAEAETLTRKAVEMAKGGDTQAMRLCLERIMPPRRDRPIRFELPPIRTTMDAQRAMSSILGAVAAGNITPQEADSVVALVASFVKTLEMTELEARVAALEDKRKKEQL